VSSTSTDLGTTSATNYTTCLQKDINRMIYKLSDQVIPFDTSNAELRTNIS